MNFLMKYLHSRSQRERRLLMLVAFVVIGLLLWTQVFEALYQELSIFRQQVPQMQNDLMSMRQTLRRVAPQLADRGKKNNNNSPAILQIVETTADQWGIRKFISRMKPGKNKTVKVWLDAIYFDDWLQWLEVLQKKDISVIAVNITRAQPQGVNMRLTLGLARN